MRQSHGNLYISNNVLSHTKMFLLLGTKSNNPFTFNLYIHTFYYQGILCAMYYYIVRVEISHILQHFVSF